MEHIKVKEVIPEKDLSLLVKFNNGIIKRYDVRKLFDEYPDFRLLENRPLFDTVTVDCGGCAVAWTPELDICEWELWDNGETV